jgi:hypothetical protein
MITSAEVQDWILKNSTAAELKLIRGLINMRQRSLFRIGDEVMFDGGRGLGILRGKVTKISAKTFGVLASNGMTWKVTPALLEPDDSKDEG